MGKLHVAPSPITNRIYAGSVLKDGMTWGSNKTDVTGEACAAGRVMAKRHLETLREAGLIEIESAPPRGNFVKKPL